jgi:hypothetical protein
VVPISAAGRVNSAAAPQSPVRGRCRLHSSLGGRPRGAKTRRPDAKKPGPKPNPGKVQREARAYLLRTRPDLAAAIPSAPAPLESVPASNALPAPTPNTPPPWPRDGYRGSDAAGRLEKSAREFIRELATPINLETMLAQRGRLLSQLSRYETEQLLTVFVETMRREVEQRLDELAAAEAEFRRPDDIDATRQRLDRLRWEAGNYVERLKTERAILIVAAENRERQAQERAAAITERIVHGRDADARQRANRPREELAQLTIDPRFK